MEVVLFIVGVFLIWKGQMQLSSKSNPWPQLKKNGRIIGCIFLIPLIISLFL